MLLLIEIILGVAAIGLATAKEYTQNNTYLICGGIAFGIAFAIHMVRARKSKNPECAKITV